MKKLRLLIPAFLLLMFLAPANSFSQNLQFSQVILVSSVQQTVPTGKVWKVESFWKANTYISYYANGSTCSQTDYHSPFMVNGQIYYVLKGVSTWSSSVYACTGNDFPMWLPAGTTLRNICSCDFLSVIEFTVVP